jgi:hypothetical protein
MFLRPSGTHLQNRRKVRDPVPDDFGVEDYINKNFPNGIGVPTGVSEDEAIQVVKKQFGERGFDCPDDMARRIVLHAWGQAQQ